MTLPTGLFPLQEIERQEDKAQALELLRRYHGDQAEQGNPQRDSYRIPSLGYGLVPWRAEEGWPLGGPVESE